MKPVMKPVVQKVPQNIIHLMQNSVHLTHMNSDQIFAGLPKLAMNRASLLYESRSLTLWVQLSVRTRSGRQLFGS
jgi:hypothetical protein